MRYVGVDLHTTNFTVCWLEEGKESFEKYELKEIEKFREKLSKKDEVAVEATGNSRYFLNVTVGKVKQVTVVAPRKFAVIRKSVNKTDKNDSRALAFFLSKGMLPASRIKAEKYEELNSLAQTRDKLVKLRTLLINKIHGILNGLGHKVKKETLTTKKGLKKIFEYKYRLAIKVELEVIRDEIESLNNNIK